MHPKVKWTMRTIFVLLDAQQASLGSCSVDEIAVKVATRIIGHYPHRKQFLVDAGFLALSHDGKLKNGSYCIIDGHPDLMFVGTNINNFFIQ